MLNEPLHGHTCTICKGEFPCWKEPCSLESQFICDERLEDKAPSVEAPPSWVC